MDVLWKFVKINKKEKFSICYFGKIKFSINTRKSELKFNKIVKNGKARLFLKKHKNNKK